MRTILEPLDSVKRWKILNEVGNNISYYNKFVQDSNLLEGWIRYRYEPNIINDFLNLSQDEIKLFTFLRRYGKTSAKGFNNIKSKPKEYIKHLLDYPEATHHIEYFNTRRAEMLPPNFKEADKGEFFNLHEIDNFIEVEIAYGGKARASLKTEAGDIIMESGSLPGQSLDPLGLASEAIPAWTNKFNRNFKDFKGSIDRHFGKISNPKGRPQLDKVVIDYKYMDEIKPTLKQDILSYIQTKHPNYIEDHLIKLNF